MRLVLVRHGETDWNRDRRIQGSTDIPLNETGRRQAREGAERLSSVEWAGIVASPLSRARETAEIIALELGLGSPIIVDEIVERHHGDLEGLTFAERQSRFPDETDVSGLESREAVVDRVRPALVALADRFGADDEVLVVTHGGVISTLVRAAFAEDVPPGGTMITNLSAHDFRVADGELVLEKFRPGPPVDLASDRVESTAR
ncbi:histidine phosphatase family protein [Agromyces atrinae]|uniref:Broad specificity phosphatase PhoE n=1 Tax=Agromyces atrinae TaxID=592376 RepID=A0A4Q2M3X2_9MICO|nr:histidine phosphatase family protein [Agromyces atrinae]NYD66159.1 broad specificity phosphatase PhoE [Agromyces atrinae]RXZ86498.1 histidine phosphatase family protein [Agromyces atrinae]